MKLASSEHTSRPWRIHELTPDFRVEDVWELPGRGEAGEFPHLVEMVASFDATQSSSAAVRALFAIRTKAGELLGWDEESQGTGARTPTLRDRMPADLRDAPRGPRQGAMPFSSLYLLEDEWAAEVANSTVHAVVHLGRVPDGDGFRAQMTVLVKPNGRFGEAYMAAIKPFRHLIVYPVLMREGGERWERARREAA